jgi:hypothetical protein
MKYFLLVLLFAVSDLGFAQSDTIDVKLGKYRFKAIYYDTSYFSTLKVSEGNDVIYKGDFDQRVESISEASLSSDGKKTILIDVYSGGAHCCNTLYACKIKYDKLIFTDTLYLADSYFDVEDIDKDGKEEILANDMMFAYAFTNFAETRAPYLVYIIENDKFKNISKKFPKIFRAQIDEWMQDLQVFVDSNYQCAPEGDDGFNSDAGSVKTLLAAITANYYTIGEVYKGYELIDKVYQCSDKENFVKILKEDYKLK